MNVTQYIKKGDLLPELEVTFKYSDGTAVDLTGATVKFFMKPATGGEVKINADAVVVDAAAGRVKYTWAGTDTDTGGKFKAEFQATYTSTSKKLTAPNKSILYIVVKEDIAD